MRKVSGNAMQPEIDLSSNCSLISHMIWPHFSCGQKTKNKKKRRKKGKKKEKIKKELGMTKNDLLLK
jgi:hypothetical protein